MAKIVRQLKSEDRKNLYVGLSSNVYEWVHNKAGSLQISKAVLIDTILTDVMVRDDNGVGAVTSAQVHQENNYKED